VKSLWTIVGVFVAVVCGVTIGIVLGSKLIDQPMMGTGPNGTLLHSGDSFPLATLTNGAGTEVSVESLCEPQPLLIIYATFGCDPCHLEVEKWRKRAAQDPPLPFDICVVTSTAFSEIGEIPDDWNAEFPVYWDVGGQLQDKYEFSRTPTLVLLDRKAEVAAVISGYSRGVDGERLAASL